jgi:hypothetical protein
LQSMSHSGEKAVAGRMSGLIGLHETVSTSTPPLVTRSPLRQTVLFCYIAGNKPLNR